MNPYSNWVKRETDNIILYMNTEPYPDYSGLKSQSYVIIDEYNHHWISDDDMIGYCENDIATLTDRNGNLVLPFRSRIRLKRQARKWVKGLKNSDNETISLLQDEIDYLLMCDALTSMYISDYKSFLESPSRYMLWVVLSSDQLCKRYHIYNASQYRKNLEYISSVKFDRRSWKQKTFFDMLQHNPKCVYKLECENGRTVLVEYDNPDGTGGRYVINPINKTQQERLLMWGVPYKRTKC